MKSMRYGITNDYEKKNILRIKQFCRGEVYNNLFIKQETNF